MKNTNTKLINVCILVIWAYSCKSFLMFLCKHFTRKCLNKLIDVRCYIPTYNAYNSNIITILYEHLINLYTTLNF